jgi:hypothetical protein
MALLPSFGIPYDQAYMAGAWISWLINLLVARQLIARGRRRTARPGQDEPPHRTRVSGEVGSTSPATK